MFFCPDPVSACMRVYGAASNSSRARRQLSSWPPSSFRLSFCERHIHGHPRQSVYKVHRKAVFHLRILPHSPFRTRLALTYGVGRRVKCIPRARIAAAATPSSRCDTMQNLFPAWDALAFLVEHTTTNTQKNTHMLSKRDAVASVHFAVCE